MSKSIEIIKEYIFLRVIIPLYMILSQNQEKLQFKATPHNYCRADVPRDFSSDCQK